MRRSVMQTDAFSSHVETDQAQQLDHANCQAENSKLLGPQWRKHERRKCCDGREERWVDGDWRYNFSRILEMLLRLEIGRKLAGFWSSRVGFFRSGVMANLYLLGKMPWLNERLASLAMRSANTVTQDLITDTDVAKSLMAMIWLILM